MCVVADKGMQLIILYLSKPVYTALMNKDELSQKYFQLQQDYWLGFWAPVFVETAFGKIMPLFPGQSGTLLFQCDLEAGYSYEEIMRVTDQTADRYFGAPGFYFTSGWSGDVAGFQNYISEQGYKRSVLLQSYALNLDKVKISESELLDVRFADSPEEYAALYQRCFAAGDIERQRVQYMVERPLNRTQNAFLYAVEKENGQPVGVVACSWQDGLGYYHLLGVLPEYRRKGYGTVLTSDVVSFLNEEQGCQFITTTSRNDADGAAILHQSLGLTHFEDWEIWTKT